MLDEMVLLKIPYEPKSATIWRKLLAIRIFFLCLLGCIIVYWLSEWESLSSIPFPKWLAVTASFIGVLPFFGVAISLYQGIPDLIVHFLDDGKLKRLLLWGDQSTSAITEKFEDTALVVFTFIYILLALISLGLIILIAIGGITLISSIFGSLFAGWPTWAIVITILLVMLLFKK